MTELEINNRLDELCGKTPCKIKMNIKAKINGRLTTTLGRVSFIKNTFEPIRIEFSKKMLETFSEEEIDQVIIHEFCHYYLLVTTGVSHGHDIEFKNLCESLGCVENKTRFSKPHNFSKEEYKYVLYCKECGAVVGKFKRKCKTIENIERYKSKCCNSRITVKNN